MEVIAGLVAKHHDSSGANSRSFRYRLSAYPAVDLEDEPEPTEETA